MTSETAPDATPLTGGQPPAEPDRKDWTWVLDRACPECGYDARAVRPVEVKNRVYANASAWRGVLAAPHPRLRPSPRVWSPLEYACHVRDVHRVFAQRVARMLADHDPVFDDWDQDEAAVAGDYASARATEVAAELVEEAARVTELYGSIEDAQWDRPGRRSNGSVFTLASLARYHLHDVEHHLVDVSGRADGPEPADAGRATA
ncbi:MAG: DinB family protein [Nocardioidaceae bacterium]